MRWPAGRGRTGEKGVGDLDDPPGPLSTRRHAHAQTAPRPAPPIDGRATRWTRKEVNDRDDAAGPPEHELRRQPLRLSARRGSVQRLPAPPRHAGRAVTGRRRDAHDAGGGTRRAVSTRPARSKTNTINQRLHVERDAQDQPRFRGDDDLRVQFDSGVRVAATSITFVPCSSSRSGSVLVEAWLLVFAQASCDDDRGRRCSTDDPAARVAAMPTPASCPEGGTEADLIDCTTRSSSCSAVAHRDPGDRAILIAPRLLGPVTSHARFGVHRRDRNGPGSPTRLRHLRRSDPPGVLATIFHDRVLTVAQVSRHQSRLRRDLLGRAMAHEIRPFLLLPARGHKPTGLDARCLDRRRADAEPPRGRGNRRRRGAVTPARSDQSPASPSR